MSETFWTVLGSIGGTALVIGALSAWLGKVWAGRILEADKQKYRKEMSQISKEYEVHKQKIRNSSFFFERQYQASQDLYALKLRMLPSYNDPDMDFEDVITHISENLHKVAEEIQGFLSKYFTVLSPEIIEKLEEGLNAADYGKFFEGIELAQQSAKTAYSRVKECTAMLKSLVDGQRLVEFKEFESGRA